VSDRDVQDLVLRALADASFRASPAWRERALADPARVERFARFLARHFYYERIVHFFKYSRALARVTGRRPEAVLRSAGFEALLPVAVLGSRETASDVANVVVGHVKAARPSQPIPYLGDLLRYEEAMMIAEAGPRVWRETGKGKRERGKGAPLELVEGTVLLELAYDLPAVLPRLLQPWTDVPQAPAQPVRLLVARSPHGRVAVARADSAVASVVALADGRKTLHELAREAGLEAADLEAAAAGLADLGAVRFATGS
jgi:hypothetical protein